MHVHFIAIGGAVMHNLAIALHKKSYTVTGSDDEIFDPSRNRLSKYGLLPEKWGWFPEKITERTDAVILGMHARKNNPELKRAQDLGIKIYSFPQYLYEQTRDKKRVVIAGSHGKTTITSMIMHVLKTKGIRFDYMVGSQLEGFETMVGLHDDSEIAIFEGDEYLSSPIDPRPKFVHYRPHITLISGISWDHINVFPNYELYKKQFADLCKMTHPGGKIIYYKEDPELDNIVRNTAYKAKALPYYAMPYRVADSATRLFHERCWFSFNLIGKYNIENLSGAMKVCQSLGINASDFLISMQKFRGANKRQELIFKDEKKEVYLDFAHAPSKVKATVEGFRENYPDKKLIVFLELHTFSSLNREFIPGYRKSLDPADEATVFFDPKVVEQKKLQEINPEFVFESFGKKNLKVITDANELKTLIAEKLEDDEAVILIMSSGNLGGIQLKELVIGK